MESKQAAEYVWQDREIRFDSKPQLLNCRRGEKIIGNSIFIITFCLLCCNNVAIVISDISLTVTVTMTDSINSVEDTKGNNGERGSLIVTNLRILWISHTNSRVNLSVGLNTVISANIKQAKSKLRGHTQALCVLAKFSTRFEFIFTSLVKNSPRLFTTVQSVLR